jgi:hypothetical protein
MELIFDNPPSPELEELLGDLEERVDVAVSRVAEHAQALQKHEVPISSRLAQKIVDVVSEVDTSGTGYKLEVFVEEFTPTEESRSGADLYISIVLKDDDTQISKGLLVQSKHRVALRKTDERRRLRNQSARMRRRAPDASHVFIFDEGQVLCADAPKSSDPKLSGLDHQSMTVGRLITEAFRCREGSPAIGIDSGPSTQQALRSVLSRLSAPLGVAFIVSRD